jgi:hypothetical protein
MPKSLVDLNMPTANPYKTYTRPYAIRSSFFSTLIQGLMDRDSLSNTGFI